MLNGVCGSADCFLLSGVLTVSIKSRSLDHLLMAEFHVKRTQRTVNGVITLSQRAHVQHVVLRLDTDVCKKHSWAYSVAVAAMDEPLSHLPELQTVTLETPRVERSRHTAERLVRLTASGRVRRRTCEQAYRAAKRARINPDDYSDDRGVVSPLWHSYRKDRWGMKG